MLSTKEQVDLAIDWFESRPNNNKRDALRELFTFCIMGEWIRVSEETKKPYLITTGESIDETG